MKLISMTEFVLEEHKKTNWNSYNLIINYANFLKQPLELWMFVPCDEDGSVLEEPIYYELWEKYGSFTQYGKKIVPPCEKYQKAKERCLFEGFKWSVAQFCDEPMLELEDENSNYLLFDADDKNFQDADEMFFETIEDLIKYNLKLTTTEIKQIEL